MRSARDYSPKTPIATVIATEGRSRDSSRHADFTLLMKRALAIRRMEEILDQLYIDEVQDLAGWDLELVEILMKPRI
jgi:DNA helicase-2/ATP-dependent DNA helicase PcrA